MMNSDMAEVVHLITHTVVASYTLSKEYGLSDAESMTIASIVSGKVLDLVSSST